MRRRCRCCGPTVDVTVKDACSGAGVSGVAVTATTTGGLGPVAGTTDSLGKVTLGLPASGGSRTWTFATSKAGYPAGTASAAVLDTDHLALTITLAATAAPHTVVHVTGCGSLNLAGATVTISGGIYGYPATVTTDALGNADFGVIPAGTYSWTAGKARFNSNSGSFTVVCGTPSGATTTLTPASGYACYACSGGAGKFACADPIPTSLHLTSQWGTIALTYQTGPPNANSWVGEQVASTGFGATRNPTTALCTPGSGDVRIRYVLGACSTAGSGLGEFFALAISVPACTRTCINMLGEAFNNVIAGLLPSTLPIAGKSNEHLSCPPSFSYSVDVVYPTDNFNHCFPPAALENGLTTGALFNCTITVIE